MADAVAGTSASAVTVKDSTRRCVRGGDQVADRDVLPEVALRVAEASEQRGMHRGHGLVPADERIAHDVRGQHDHLQAGRQDLHGQRRVGHLREGGGDACAQAVAGA